MGNNVLQTNIAQDPNTQFKPPSAAYLIFPLIGPVTSLWNAGFTTHWKPAHPKTQQLSWSFWIPSEREWQHNASFSSWLTCFLAASPSGWRRYMRSDGKIWSDRCLGTNILPLYCPSLPVEKKECKATWSRERCPCPLQESWTQTIPWFYE